MRNNCIIPAATRWLANLGCWACVAAAVLMLVFPASLGSDRFWWVYAARWQFLIGRGIAILSHNNSVVCAVPVELLSVLFALPPLLVALASRRREKFLEAAAQGQWAAA